MARVNWEQVAAAAKAVAGLPDDVKPLNFYSYFTPDGEVVAADMYPPLHHPMAVDDFFFVCLHNYGFWHGDERGYAGPLFGTLGGKKRKGSDLLWRVCMRQFDGDSAWFRPERLAAASDDELIEKLFVDDNGVIAFPDLPYRLAITREYGRWFADRCLTPGDLVRVANKLDKSLTTFLRFMRHVRGYDTDPLEKRQLLLAMALHNRPERFLEVGDLERWRPIVDYHLQRVCLRSGMVELGDDQLEANRSRAWVSDETEADIRQQCFEALKQVQDDCGRGHAVTDLAFWKARRSCPEMEEPDCGKCHFSGFCAKRTDLFQPVFRTTDY